MNMRRFFRRAAAGALAGGTLLSSVAFYAFRIEPYRLVIKHVNVQSQAWPDDRMPLSIAVLSDLHIGGTVDMKRLKDIVTRTNQTNPDVVVIPGDLLLGKYKYRIFRDTPVNLGLVGEALGELKTRYGTFAVLGNHDWWQEGPTLKAVLEQHGIRVLENRSARIRAGDKSFLMAGIADFKTRKPDIAAAFAAAEGGREEPIIVFGHNPEAFKPIDNPAVAIMVGGHTHCGQVNAGVRAITHKWIPEHIPNSWICGLYNHRGMPGYTSPGIGTSRYPVRFMSPPQVDVLHLY